MGRQFPNYIPGTAEVPQRDSHAGTELGPTRFRRGTSPDGSCRHQDPCALCPSPQSAGWPSRRRHREWDAPSHLQEQHPVTSVPQAFAGVGERGLPPHRLREEKRGRAQVTHRRGKLSLHTPVTRPSCPPSRQPGSSWGSRAHTWHPLSLMQGPQPERDRSLKTPFFFSLAKTFACARPSSCNPFFCTSWPHQCRLTLQFSG